MLARVPSQGANDAAPLVRAMVAWPISRAKGFAAGDLSTLMSPRTVITWAENCEIFRDGSRVPHVLPQQVRRGRARYRGEYYQRCFGQDLAESAGADARRSAEPCAAAARQQQIEELCGAAVRARRPHRPALPGAPAAPGRAPAALRRAAPLSLAGRRRLRIVPRRRRAGAAPDVPTSPRTAAWRRRSSRGASIRGARAVARRVAGAARLAGRAPTCGIASNRGRRLGGLRASSRHARAAALHAGAGDAAA